MDRKTRRALETAGWYIARQSRHVIWRCPCGDHQVSVSVSPSDHRAERNRRRDFLKSGCRFLPDL